MAPGRAALAAAVTIAVIAAAAAAAPPVNLAAPRLTGSAREGQTLVVHPGRWDQPQAGFAFQWQRCNRAGRACKSIPGARGLVWTPLDQDVGRRLRALVSAGGATTGGATTIATAPTNVITKSREPKASPSDPAVAAAGDIACAPGAKVTRTSCHQRQTANLLRRSDAAILMLGDAQYECGAASAWTSFDSTWGRFKDLIRPVIGNHEYQPTGGVNCPGDGSGYFDYFGEAAGPPSKGYYSFDLGEWHLIALNGECEHVSCAAGSAQERWLRADLAATNNPCILAFWHQPRFISSVTEPDRRYTAFWNDLYKANADLILNGHVHEYARHAPSDPSGRLKANGIRQFIVGTGGHSFYPLAFARPNSLVENFQSATFGILRLKLARTGYTWRFVPEKGRTFTDSGFGVCHAKG